MDGWMLVHMESERPASRLLFVFVILPGAIFQMGLYVCFFHCYQCAPRNFSLGSPASAAFRLHPASASNRSLSSIQSYLEFFKCRTAPRALRAWIYGRDGPHLAIKILKCCHENRLDGEGNWLCKMYHYYGRLFACNDNMLSAYPISCLGNDVGKWPLKMTAAHEWWRVMECWNNGNRAWVYRTETRGSCTEWAVSESWELTIELLREINKRVGK